MGTVAINGLIRVQVQNVDVRVSFYTAAHPELSIIRIYNFSSR